MPSPHRPGAAWRERGVLLLGLVSAAVLAGAAFLPANDPETVARTALAQLAARTEQAALDEWQRMLRDPAPIAAASSATFESDGRDPVELGMPRVSTQPDPDASRAAYDPVCGALLAEADRVEAQEGDVDGALKLVDEALGKRPSALQRVTGALRAIQLAGKLGARERVPRALAELAAGARDEAALDLRGSERLAFALLAAEPLVEGGVRCLVPDLDRALRRWCTLAILETPAHVERIGTDAPWFALVGAEALPVLTARLLALAPCARAEAGPRPDPATDLLKAAPRLAALRALDRYVGAWPADAGTDVWNVVPVRADYFARRGSALGPWTGFFVTRDDLGAALVERLNTGALLPDGMELDFDGGRTALGAALRPRVALLGDAFAFTLRHRDPEALVRSQSRRQSWMRGALLAMAAFAAGAGFVMARALRRERKLAELKTTFVANVSHELRTPLASILLMAENLEAGRTRDAAATQRYHALIRREALRLARLVDDVLDFSRLERGRQLEVRREEVDPRAVVEEWCAEFRAWAAEHGLELALDVRDLPASVALDRDALRRALFNLLDNARKHSGSKAVRFEARGADGALLLSVADGGRGIPARQRASVFEPFERLREGEGAAPGAGLGLAIVKEIVLAHGGTIAVRDPAAGPGAVFELRLPVARAGGAPGAAEDAGHGGR